MVALGPGLLALKARVTSNQLGIARVSAHALELIGPEGEFAVGALVSAAEGEVLFTHVPSAIAGTDAVVPIA